MGEFVAKTTREMAPVVPAPLGSYNYLVNFYIGQLDQNLTDFNPGQLAYLQNSSDPAAHAALDSITDKLAEAYDVEARPTKEWQTHLAEARAAQETEVAAAAGVLGCSAYIPEY